MNTVTTVLTTETICSDDGSKRYLLKKTWDKEKPKLTIIMLAPSSAADIELDSSTMLVLNNAYRLNFGSVAIANLSEVLNDFSLNEADVYDAENINYIVSSAKKSDVIIYAPGIGKAKNKTFQDLQRNILSALKPFESKLFCIGTSNGNARFQHPLSPAVRSWFLYPFKVSDVIDDDIKAKKH